MDNSIYLEKLHSELLDIMSEIDRVCTLCNLQYYLVGGTLLGAVRHKGFIPWDDDLDIAMPRSDFEVFVTKAKEYINDNYEIRWITTDRSYWHIFAKVCKKNTLFKERGLSNFQPTGIFVDIFPLDKCSSYSPELEIKKNWIVRLNSIIWVKNDQSYITGNYLRRFLSRLFSTLQIQRIMIRIMKSAEKKGKTHFANFGSQYQLSKQTMPVGWYGAGVCIPFEDRSFMAPSEYKKVLSSIYGDNYMDLPPIEKRRCHYPERVLFSDGIEMTFDTPQHIVTIYEQNN